MNAKMPTATDMFRIVVVRWLNRVLMFPSILLLTKKESSELSNSPRRRRVKGAIDQRHGQFLDQACRDRPRERAATVPVSVLTPSRPDYKRPPSATTVKSTFAGRSATI